LLLIAKYNIGFQKSPKLAKIAENIDHMIDIGHVWPKGALSEFVELSFTKTLRYIRRR
jgi:hypothetical protein